MKKFLALILAMMVMLMAFAGCAANTGDTAQSSDTTANTDAADTAADAAPAATLSEGDLIGVSLTNKAAERWLRDGNLFEAALAENGWTADVQYANNAPQTQIEQIENMITKGCKVIIVAPVDNGALSSVLKTAKEDGVIVINYDLGLTGTGDVDYFVGFDNTKVGTMQAEAIVKGLGLDQGETGPFNMEIIGGALSEYNSYLYYGSAMDVLQPYIDQGVLVVKSGQTTLEETTIEDWKLEVLAARLDNLLTTYYSDGSTLDAVLCPVDYFSTPIATRLEEMGYGSELPMPIITGNDATESVVKAIANGEVTQTVLKDSSKLVDTCMDILNALKNGEQPAMDGEYDTGDGTHKYPAVFADMYSVDKDNLQELVFDSGFYTEEQIFG